MRPRPFKFFFGIAIAMMLLFFLARIVLVAVIFAAIASSIYFILRSMANFFRRLNWQDEGEHYTPNYATTPRFADWPSDKAESLFDVNPGDFVENKRVERIIRL